MPNDRATPAAGPIDRHIGQQIRRRRSEQGLSQEALAVAIGVTFQQVQKYEKGWNRVAASRLLDMARALDAPVGYFFEGLDGAVPGAKPDGAQGVIALVKIYRDLKPQFQQALRKMAHTLADAQTVRAKVNLQPAALAAAAE